MARTYFLNKKVTELLFLLLKIDTEMKVCLKKQEYSSIWQTFSIKNKYKNTDLQAHWAKSVFLYKTKKSFNRTPLCTIYQGY